MAENEIQNGDRFHLEFLTMATFNMLPSLHYLNIITKFHAKYLSMTEL